MKKMITKNGFYRLNFYLKDVQFIYLIYIKNDHFRLRIAKVVQNKRSLIHDGASHDDIKHLKQLIGRTLRYLYAYVYYK